MEVRQATNEDLLSGLAPILHYSGHGPTEEKAGWFLRVIRPERMRIAEENGTVVGGAAAYSFELTVPGAVVPAAGVTVVGVLPTHRRRGVFTELMRGLLDDAHERGEPLAVLWASEETLYERFGFGLASLCGEIDLLRIYGGFRRVPEHGGSFRLLGPDEPVGVLPSVYDRVAAATPGMFARSRDWWKARILHDPEDRREGSGELARVVLERDGEALAYALYRLKLGFEAGSSTGEVNVVEAMGVSSEATAGIWRYLLDVDLMERVQGELLPIDHPLFLLLEQPRRLRFRLTDSLWVRLVDVGSALAARGLEGDVVLEVTDAFCPWNNGRFALDGSKSTDEADLRLEVSDLGTVYLGGFTLPQLARAGRIEEVAPGAVARADAAFRTDRAPWCPEIF